MLGLCSPYSAMFGSDPKVGLASSIPQKITERLETARELLATINYSSDIHYFLIIGFNNYYNRTVPQT